MTRHVILLTDAHQPVAPALVDGLRAAGIVPLVEVLRGVGEESHVAPAAPGARGDQETRDEQLPLAVLYEVVPGADTLELHAAIEHAVTTWPGAPVVACRHRPEDDGQALRTADAATLKRLGFREVADDPAQLPALLRDLEERGMTGELKLPAGVAGGVSPAVTLLPPGNLSARALRAAFDLVASLHFTNDQTGAAHAALAGIAPLVRADRWTIYLTAETSGSNAALEPLAVRGLTESERTSHGHDLRSALLGRVLALSGSESQAAREAAQKSETFKSEENGRRIIALPLVSAEKVMGVLEGVREGAPARHFTNREAALLGALVLPVAAALGNGLRIAEAERLSQTDDLTKLHNARYLRQYLLSEVKRARRYGSSVAAFFFDLDNFKQVNDVHGHLVGSHVLMEMATIILSSVRDTDVVARYGGDEFVVVLPESSAELAAVVAERVREKVARHSFTGGRAMRLRLTASFGVGIFPDHAQSPQQLIAAADSAMYEAKAAGKNCVRFAAAPATRVPRGEKAFS